MAVRMTCVFSVVVALALWANCPKATAKLLVDQTRFGTDPASLWEAWAPRDEIKPAFSIDAQVSRTGQNGSLRIECTDPIQWGGWRRVVDGAQAGAWYRFDAYYRPHQVKQEHRTVLPRLDWLNRQGERAGQPEFIYQTEDAADGWKHVWAVAPAPADAAEVRLELFFGWSPGGTVWWDDVSFGSADPPKPRSVKVATLYHRPDGNASARENIDEFCRWIDRAAQSDPDIIVLPEGMTMVGTPFSCADVAEPIPGPTSERMGEMARKHNCYIVACYNERDGKAVYNTAILVNRKGHLVGKYRKLYIPRNEVTDGELPGKDALVFDTDFGTIGVMICWDVQYPEPAQLMALKGAEIIFLPIWGGSEHLIKARAIENHVFVVTSGYDVPSMIVDPEGAVLATARASGKDKGEIAVAEIDLNRRYVDSWDGYMRAVLMKEHRDDLQ